MGLLEDLRQLSEKIKARYAMIHSEEGTKQALILPLLTVLGYDVHDPMEVQPGYGADFREKGTRGQLEKVDYAIHSNGKPAIFIECKSVDAKLDDHDAQLARYFNSTPSVKVAILTNGIRYRFFTEKEPNIMNSAPFFEFNMLSVTERDADVLRRFQKNDFDPARVDTHVKEVIYVVKLVKTLTGILDNPTEDFVRWLIRHTELVEGNLTSKLVEQFVPIVKKAIETTLLGITTRSIKQQPPEPSDAPTSGAPTQSGAIAAGAAGGETSSSRIVTTPEELEVYEAIRKICADSHYAGRYPIQYKGAVNYFGINLGSSRKWFLRAFCDTKKKSLTSRLPVDKMALLAQGFEVEASPEVFGTSRVYFSAVKDLDKLHALILFAYEEECRRQETGGVGGEEGDGSEIPTSG